jgi:hypothetical protein
MPVVGGFTFADHAALNAGLLARLRPDVVLTALVGHGFDVLDIARTLGQLGFRGRYRAVVEHLPNPALIRSEVASVAPQVDFDILSLPDLRAGWD